MDGLKAYALNKKYTDESIAGTSGILAGKNCTIESTTKHDGRTTIVFKWTADNGNVRRTSIDVLDGTPIYEYQPGQEYHYGDLVIYEAAFYRCVSDCVAGETLDPTYFAEIGSPDGNYDIVNDASQLPNIFTASDRKMYYSIEDTAFWLWNGAEWVLQTVYATTDDIESLFN